MQVRTTVAALLLIAAVGCGKSSSPTSSTPTPSTSNPANPAPPSASGCSVSLTPATQQAPVAGGTFTVAAATNSGCAWTASRLTNWLNVVGPSGAAGIGNGTITYTVQSNSDVARSGQIVVHTNDSTASVTVSQDGATADCRYTINPSAQRVGASGGRFSFTATRNTANGCAWSASTSTPWIALTGAVSGLSPGTIAYSVDVNASRAERTGAITIAWHGGSAEFVVDQSGGR